TAALEDERRATAAKYHQMETEFALREQKRQKEIEQSLLALIKEFETQVSDYISQIKDPAVAAKLSKEREKRLFQLKKQAGEKVQQLLAKPSQENRKVVTSSELLPLEFSIGDKVETELGQQGVVEDLHGDEVSVRIGNMRFRTRTSSLKPAKASDKKGRKLPQGINLVRAESERDSKETFTSEINVIGCLAEEACDRVDKFLDKAYMASYDRVRVIHGAGTGKLRRAIGELLHAHPHVAKFYQATSSEGGIGATIVELRQ
ncbi:MAG: Smr/MutS family protein, partial [Blastocatellia bacterium]|nr:Smr/MutS family protein [Blastocatellia bacterium]